MKLLKDYFELQDQIFQYFDYEENWRVIPLRDETSSYWTLIGMEDDGIVVWSDEPLGAESVKAGNSIFRGHIYTQRFLPKFVYRAAEYTMISIDTRVDGNKLLMVFTNAMECKDGELRSLYLRHWGESA